MSTARNATSAPSGGWRPELSVVLGTLNRLELLRRCLDSIRLASIRPVVIHVTDAGSTDGTVEFLASEHARGTLVAHLVGRKIGQAKSINDVLAAIDTRFVCWVSDDNILVPGALDHALQIARWNPDVGMVALKVRDVEGPFTAAPYIGGISTIGILNVNQGLLPTVVFRRLGGFDEEYRDYGIDPDLTAKVLFAGYKVVYTRRVCILHHRQWATAKDPEGQRILQEKQARSLRLYEERYQRFAPRSWTYRLKLAVWRWLEPRLIDRIKRGVPHASVQHRDWMNAFRGRFVRLWDPLTNGPRAYHLVQKCPSTLRRRPR